MPREFLSGGEKFRNPTHHSTTFELIPIVFDYLLVNLVVFPNQGLLSARYYDIIATLAKNDYGEGDDFDISMRSNAYLER